MLGEDNEFPAATGTGVHLWRILQEVGELFPLFVVSGLYNGVRLGLESLQNDDFGFQLFYGRGRGGLIHHIIYPFLILATEHFISGFINIFRHVLDVVLHQGLCHMVTTADQLHLLLAVLQTFAATFEGLVDSLRTGRQPALQQR